jgi:hypothetical protein
MRCRYCGARFDAGGTGRDYCFASVCIRRFIAGVVSRLRRGDRDEVRVRVEKAQQEG